MSKKQHSIHFAKMHGLGNDFVVINATKQPVDALQLSVPQLADRHIGIGFDQLLVIEPSEQADFFCRIFNADGSEAEQCGNGLRCVARFIHEKGLHAKSSLHFETKAGIFPIRIQDYDHIHVTMGAPVIQAPLYYKKSDVLSGKEQEPAVPASAGTAKQELIINVISVGNLHAIINVESVDTIPADKLGRKISTHSYFPHDANVGFMQVITPSHIRLRTFERGVGETHACGSNACAAAAAGMINGLLQHKVDVEFRYGTLSVEWEGGDKPIHMTGPATQVYEGVINVK